MLVQGVIIARIDYCNGLLYGVPAVHLSNANCNVLRIPQRDLSATHPDTVILPQCRLKWNWLPVKFRICYKIAVISFKPIHNLAPVYLSNLINIKRCPRYNLRSNVGGTLQDQDPTAKSKCTLCNWGQIIYCSCSKDMERFTGLY